MGLVWKSDEEGDGAKRMSVEREVCATAFQSFSRMEFFFGGFSSGIFGWKLEAFLGSRGKRSGNNIGDMTSVNLMRTKHITQCSAVQFVNSASPRLTASLSCARDDDDVVGRLLGSPSSMAHTNATKMYGWRARKTELTLKGRSKDAEERAPCTTPRLAVEGSSRDLISDG